MRRRLIATVLAVTTLAVIAFFVPAAIAIRSAQQRQDLLELQREASVVATKVATSERLDESILQPISADHRIGLYGPGGRRIAGDGPDIAGDLITTQGLRGAIAEGRLGDSLIAAVPVRLLLDGSAVAVRIEAPRSESDGRYVRSLLGLGGAAVAILALAGGVAIWLSRRMTRPIEELRSWADHQRAADPPATTGIGEIDGLRDALVTSRERIDLLIDRERSFSSQVSHQLRTPVAAMRVAIETELAAPRNDPTEVLRESVGQLDRLESTITSLLALARDTSREPVECDIDQVVTARAGEWSRAAAAAGRPVSVVAGAGIGLLDVEAVGHVLDVLLDNAIRHGHGPITVAAGRRDQHVVIDVADAGPTPAAADTFADRGSDSSHGIGLRLARSLAEASHGTLELLDGPTTTFRLTLTA